MNDSENFYSGGHYLQWPKIDYLYLQLVGAHQCTVAWATWPGPKENGAAHRGQRESGAPSCRGGNPWCTMREERGKYIP